MNGRLWTLTSWPMTAERGVGQKPLLHALALDLWGLQEVPLLTFCQSQEQCRTPRGSGLPTSKAPSVHSNHLAQALVRTPLDLGSTSPHPHSARPSVLHLQPTACNHRTLRPPVPPQPHTGLSQIPTLSPTSVSVLWASGPNCGAVV